MTAHSGVVSLARLKLSYCFVPRLYVGILRIVHVTADNDRRIPVHYLYTVCSQPGSLRGFDCARYISLLERLRSATHAILPD